LDYITDEIDKVTRKKSNVQEVEGGVKKFDKAEIAKIKAIFLDGLLAFVALAGI
jgi:hypothetical protein